MAFERLSFEEAILYGTSGLVGQVCFHNDHLPWWYLLNFGSQILKRPVCLVSCYSIAAKSISITSFIKPQ